MTEKVATSVTGEAAEVFYSSLSNLPGNVKRRLSIYLIRSIFDTMVVPAIDRACALDREGSGRDAELQESYRLPCDVLLAPATTIRRGCKLGTLITAMELRRRMSMEFCRKEWDGVNDPPCHPGDENWQPCELCSMDKKQIGGLT